MVQDVWGPRVQGGEQMAAGMRGQLSRRRKAEKHWLNFPCLGASDPPTLANH